MGNQDATVQDGSSPDRAVIVGKVSEEYKWIAQNCPGFSVVKQELAILGERAFDVLTLRSERGIRREVYFDISAFLGKEKQPGPPCPYCGVPLRTPRAKQCGKCGMDWHDPANVIRHRKD